MTTCGTGDQSVSASNEFCRNPVCAREGLRRVLAGQHRRWSETVGRWSASVDGATTSRPHAENVQVSDSPLVSQSAGCYCPDEESGGSDGFAEMWPAHSDEWRKLAAGWGFGGICNAVDELAKRDPAAAPRYVIEAARLLRFVAEDLGIDSRHPLGSETWRAEP